MRYPVLALLVLMLSAACAGSGTDRAARAAVPSPNYDSPISGTIGVAVANRNAEVVVIAVRAASAAARAGIRSGDLIRRCNGKPVASAREFERRVLDSRPGTIMRLEIAHGAESTTVELPVDEILMATLV